MLIFAWIVRKVLGLGALVVFNSFARIFSGIPIIVEHVVRHVFMDSFAVMENLLIFKMILTIMVLVLKSVLDIILALLQCVILLVD
ncbi:hypothetical protein REPUB_Repub20aG0127300 [Reevesia pubescens]